MERQREFLYLGKLWDISALLVWSNVKRTSIVGCRDPWRPPTSAAQMGEWFTEISRNGTLGAGHRCGLVLYPNTSA